MYILFKYGVVLFPADKTLSDIPTKEIILYATFLIRLKELLSPPVTTINWYAARELTHPWMAHLLSVDCNQ